MKLALRILAMPFLVVEILAYVAGNLIGNSCGWIARETLGADGFDPFGVMDDDDFGPPHHA